MASMTNLTSTWAQENTNDKIITGDMLEKSNSFREKVGFEPQHSLTINEFDSQSIEAFGVYLTTEEVNELNYRSEVIQATKPYLEKLETSFKDTFGGIYFDHKKGKGILRIALVDDETNSIKTLLADFPHKDRLELYNVKYSLAELIEAQETVSKILVENNWTDTSSEISIQENKVILYVKSASSSTNGLLENINSVIDGDMLFIKTVNDPVINTASRSDYNRPVFPGLELEFPTGYCTSGVAFKTRSGQYWISSAGHCGTFGQSVYQGGEFLGTVTYKKMGQHTDILLVGPLSEYNVSGKIYGESTGVYMVDPPIVEGQIVCKSGISTGITCGPVRTLLAFGFTHDYDGNRVFLNRLVSFAADSHSGDSGALVYTPGTYKGASGILSGSQYLTENRITYSRLDNMPAEEFGIPIQIIPDF